MLVAVTTTETRECRMKIEWWSTPIVIPQISVIMGHCASGDVYAVAAERRDALLDAGTAGGEQLDAGDAVGGRAAVPIEKLL